MAEWRSGLSIASLTLVAAAGLGACSVEDPQPAPQPTGSPVFVDSAAELGVDFTHFNGMTGSYLFPEMMGSGGALLDYDGDGDLDLYLVQGARLGPGEPLFPPHHPEPLTDRLYRNDLGGAGDRWSFVDVTDRKGATSTEYGMGVAVGDYDGDGWLDLYVTNLGPNRLLRNRGDGTFVDVTGPSGAGDDGWGVPSLFTDFDLDGRLDLYVGNYVEYRVSADRACFATTGARDYCGPTAYPGARDRLFRNRGDGSFIEISAEAGLARPGRTLGAISGDLDGDGRVDLYVANDGEANRLWLNREGASFEEAAVPSGVAVDAEGLPQASMGVELGDFDNDGDDDLFLTHLDGESSTLYRNEGAGRFLDVSRAVGVSAASLGSTGFGAASLDLDLDGWLDLLTVNGAVKTLEAQRRRGDRYPLKQPMLLLRNLGGRFEQLGSRAGEVFERPAVGRGAAAGDLDRDGDTDVLVTNNNGPAALLVLQHVGAPPRWIGVLGPSAGFRVEVTVEGRTRSVASRTAGSYGSARAPGVVVGLGWQRTPIDLAVDLAGRRLVVRAAPIDRYFVFGR